MVKVTVKFFAVGRDITGSDELMLELPEGTTAGEVLIQVKQRYPAFEKVAALLVAVNLDYADTATVLYDGDELAVIPPVSGG
ncbi:MAG: molybdopterin converting factor subunit 1 [Rhizobacter sp.]|nr:molybdopterin converting factor subunit 1 [Chlorobiales bacterium]